MSTPSVVVLKARVQAVAVLEEKKPTVSGQ
jgi:hypothetical protein